MPTPQGPQRPPAPSPEAFTTPKAGNSGDKNSAEVQKRIPAAPMASRPQQTSLSSRTVSPSPTVYHDYLTTTKNTLEQQNLLAQSLNTLNDLSQGKPCEEGDFVLTYTDNLGVEHQIFPPTELMQQYMKKTSDDVRSKLQKAIAPFVATNFDKKTEEIDQQMQLLDTELMNTEARLQNIGKSFTPYKSPTAFIIENVPLEIPKVQSFSNYQPAASNAPKSPKSKPEAGKFLFKQTIPASQTHDPENEWPEPPPPIFTQIPYQQGKDNLRLVLPPEHRPQNRKVYNFTGENPEEAIEIGLKSVTNEEIEELEYRVILKPDSIQTKLKQERAIAKLQGQQGSQEDKDFLTQNEFQAHFEDVEASKGVINVDNGVVEFWKKTTQIHYETAANSSGSGIASAQGLRGTMEDAHMARQFSITIQGQEIPINITAVFDGHGGDEWAQYAQKHIVNHLQRRLHQFNEYGLNDTGIWNALKIAFVDLDREMLDDYPEGSGTTANVALNIGGDLWVANLGDSRSILVDANGNTEQISEDAKPNDERYHATIKKRGGVVPPSWRGIPRVNGILAVARSLGDNSQNMAIPVDGDPERASGAISARPKVTKIPANELKGKVLIQTCDGIPDVASSHEIGNAVIQDLKAGNTSTIAAAKLVARAFEAGSKDNLSAIVTKLDPQFPLGNMHEDFQQVSDPETREWLKFYETTNTKISGLQWTLNEIWAMSNEELEGRERIILPFMFPSTASHEAPIISGEMFNAINDSPRIQNNINHSIQRMLSLWGIQLNSNDTVTVALTEEEKTEISEWRKEHELLSSGKVVLVERPKACAGRWICGDKNAATDQISRFLQSLVKIGRQKLAQDIVNTMQEGRASFGYPPIQQWGEDINNTRPSPIPVASFVPPHYVPPVKGKDAKPLGTLEEKRAAHNKIQKVLNKELAVDDINLDDEVERDVIKERLILISGLGTLLSNKAINDDHLRRATTELSENLKKAFTPKTEAYFNHMQRREVVQNRRAELKESILEQTEQIEQRSKQCENIFNLLLNKDPSGKTIRQLTHELGVVPGKAQHIDSGLKHMFERAAKNNAPQTEKPTPDPKRLPEPVTAPSLQTAAIDAPENITPPLIPDDQTNWKGCVIPFRLDYKGRSATDAERQARCILDEALRRLEDKNITGIGITYSANHEQTETILRTYKKGDWQTRTSGAHQADVMATMESLQASEANYQPLRGRLRIVPISTCQQAGGAKEVTDQQFTMCIDNVEDLLKDGWQILGWQNQDSVRSQRHPFAIGGGVSTVMPQSHKDTIQNLLMRHD
ncbi:PP2C family serine/threonine-protein phosphatase [Endozoicomonas ascidiicola]|uniref:PP2C family serine/threonine-protein phosphatase n=1 Tax=Endozoicomonas ascidiicola TaxID=1698521 RepID=UPI00082BE8C9|nr:PP2C family protein-serine/threonine phosphatase [Endozoicomonas ascidiicola]